jgi:hypothetical protein
MFTSNLCSVRSWSEVYKLLRAKAEAGRGVVMQSPVDHGAQMFYPRTTVRDAHALASVFDDAIIGHAPLALVGDWDVLTDVLALLPEDISDVYVGNRSLWELLAEATRELDRVHVAPPAPALIDAALRVLGAPSRDFLQQEARDPAPVPREAGVPSCDPTGPEGHRNATSANTGASPAAMTWSEVALMQLDVFQQLRGDDSVSGHLLSRAPRTTVADVRKVAAYWSSLAKEADPSFEGKSTRAVFERWRSILSEVDRIPSDADPQAVYSHNLDFWEAVITIAIHIDIATESFAGWQMLLEATRKTIQDLPNVLLRLPSTFLASAQGFLRATLAKPLLYAGVGVGGLVLVIYFLKSNRESGS